MGQTILSLIQVFQKMLETEIKYELLVEIYKESLRVRPFEDWWKFCERTIGIEPYCLLWFFCSTPVLENQVNSKIKGCYGSSANNWVDGVQTDNLVYKDNTGWDNELTGIGKGALTKNFCHA